MTSKIKNIIIFTVIAVLLVLIYIFFIKKSPEEQNLVSSTTIVPVAVDVGVSSEKSLIAKDLLSLLLSVKSIKLDDTIFSEKAFINLSDSSISLVPPGDEGRPNPFAPIGFEGASQISTQPEPELETPDVDIDPDIQAPIN